MKEVIAVWGVRLNEGLTQRDSEAVLGGREERKPLKGGLHA